MDPEPGTAEATRAVFQLLKKWLFLEPAQRVVPSAIPGWDPDIGNVGKPWEDWIAPMRTSFAHQYASDYEDVGTDVGSSSRPKSQPKQGA